ncbi:MAG: zf-C3Hc3H domain-containing protein [Verrucomicrobiales bacterium]|nr:zf-C3Hc3H domain-containing protein [Verrucomicrobiales bacterium]
MRPHRALPPDHQRCEYTKIDGKRCTNPQDVLYHPLCEHHHRVMLAKLEESRIESEQMAFGETILSPDQPLDSAQAVNAALTRIFRGLCENRITPRHAASLAYVGQLIISTLPGLAREAEAGAKNPVGDKAAAIFSELTQALRRPLPPDAPYSTDDPQAGQFNPLPGPEVPVDPHLTTLPSPEAPASGFALGPEPDSTSGNGHAGGVGRPGVVDPRVSEEVPDPGPGNSETPRAARERELRAGAKARRYIARSP